MVSWKAIIQNINHIILMETSKARIPYLDFLKFFAIGSVLLGHSVEQLTGNDYWDNYLEFYLYLPHAAVHVAVRLFLRFFVEAHFWRTVEKEVRAVALALGDGFYHSVDGGVRHGA